MEEILPGVFHWSRVHPRIHRPVHSYYLSRSRVVTDPMVPDEGLEWFVEARDHRPSRVLLSSRHHLREAPAFVDRFGIPVLCNKAGLHALQGEPSGHTLRGSDGPQVRGFEVGEELAPGVFAREVGALCPDETALHAQEERALVIGDGVIRGSRDGALSFVPDALMGDDPEAVKRGLRDSFRRLCDELDFDALLLAHGEPLPAGGRDALAAFAG